jgi:hypothetical protein
MLRQRIPNNLSHKDAERVYNAKSLALWRYGPDQGIMSAHLIILWQSYKIEDHQLASELLGQFLNRAKKKWERRGVVDLRSGRTRWRRCEPFRILVSR